MPTTKKRCTRCKTLKSTADFSLDRQKPDRLCSWCKGCQRAQTVMRVHNDVNVSTKRCGQCDEIKLATQFSRRSLSADGLTDRCKDCFRGYVAEWRARNEESVRVKAKVRAKLWHAAHPDGARIHKLRRRARGGKELSAKTIMAIVSSQAGICVGCGLLLDEKFHIDHIVPICKGGTSARENLQALHARCNLIKGTKLPSDWHGVAVRQAVIQ